MRLDADGWPLFDERSGTRTARRAGRVLIVDPSGAMLLVRFADRADRSRQWLSTVGGGAEPGESPAEAAARELFEETGLRLGPDELGAPLALHRSVIEFSERTLIQDEVIFGLVRDRFAPSDAGFTALERETVAGWEWLTPAALEAASATPHPPEVGRLAQRLLGRSRAEAAAPVVLGL